MEETKSIIDAVSALLDDKEVVKVIVSFVGVLLTAIVAGVIGYFAREAPMKTVKLEQLKFISQLTNDRAWKDPSNNFVIEEVFKEYFRVFIPIEVITFICMSKSRYYGFVFYSHVRNWVEFKDSKFIVPNRQGVALISVTIGLWGLVFFHVGATFFSLGFTSLAAPMSEASFLPMLASFISCLASMAFFYMACLCFNRVFHFPERMNSFLREFQGYVEFSTYPVNSAKSLLRTIMLVVPVILVCGFWGWVWYAKQ